MSDEHQPSTQLLVHLKEECKLQLDDNPANMIYWNMDLLLREQHRILIERLEQTKPNCDKEKKDLRIACESLLSELQMVKVILPRTFCQMLPVKWDHVRSDNWRNITKKYVDKGAVLAHDVAGKTYGLQRKKGWEKDPSNVSLDSAEEHEVLSRSHLAVQLISKIRNIWAHMGLKELYELVAEFKMDVRALEHCAQILQCQDQLVHLKRCIQCIESECSQTLCQLVTEAKEKVSTFQCNSNKVKWDSVVQTLQSCIEEGSPYDEIEMLKGFVKDIKDINIVDQEICRQRIGVCQALQQVRGAVMFQKLQTVAATGTKVMLKMLDTKAANGECSGEAIFYKLIEETSVHLPEVRFEFWRRGCLEFHGNLAPSAPSNAVQCMKDMKEKGSEFFKWLLEKVQFLVVAGELVLLPHAASESVLVNTSSNAEGDCGPCQLWQLAKVEEGHGELSSKPITLKTDLLETGVVKESDIFDFPGGVVLHIASHEEPEEIPGLSFGYQISLKLGDHQALAPPSTESYMPHMDTQDSHMGFPTGPPSLLHGGSTIASSAVNESMAHSGATQVQITTCPEKDTTEDSKPISFDDLPTGTQASDPYTPMLYKEIQQEQLETKLQHAKGLPLFPIQETWKSTRTYDVAKIAPDPSKEKKIQTAPAPIRAFQDHSSPQVSCPA